PGWSGSAEQPLCGLPGARRGYARRDALGGRREGAVLPQFLWQSREPLVKGCSDRNDCIVAPTNEVDQALIGGLLFVPRQVLDMAGTAQQDLHLAPPVFLLNLEQCFEFAQVMG